MFYTVAVMSLVATYDMLCVCVCRHWSLYEAMKYSNYISTKLFVWNNQTNRALEDLLVNVGVSKTAYLQEYAYMDIETK